MGVIPGGGSFENATPTAIFLSFVVMDSPIMLILLEVFCFDSNSFFQGLAPFNVVLTSQFHKSETFSHLLMRK